MAATQALIADASEIERAAFSCGNAKRIWNI
jgi:predicted TIM-barrel fold metal-dependent hydrolase